MSENVGMSGKISHLVAVAVSLPFQSPYICHPADKKKSSHSIVSFHEQMQRPEGANKELFFRFTTKCVASGKLVSFSWQLIRHFWN